MSIKVNIMEILMNKNKKRTKPISGWAHSEFGEVDCHDKRLTHRLLKLADSFAESPENSINQACESWSETKAAYRFFQNDNISESKILAQHVEKTVERASKYKTDLFMGNSPVKREILKTIITCSTPLKEESF